MGVIWTGIGAVVVGLLVVGLASEQQYDPKPTDQYCEMVQIHNNSNGEYGWPDYDNMFDHCADEYKE